MARRAELANEVEPVMKRLARPSCPKWTPLGARTHVAGRRAFSDRGLVGDAAVGRSSEARLNIWPYCASRR